jgi:hypothetical protein
MAKKSTPQCHVILPLTLNTPAFQKAWADYEEYRRQRRLPKLIPMSVQRQWDKLSDHGETVAIAAIDQTITNGWQGIFPERVQADAPLAGRPMGGNAQSGRSSLGALQMQLKAVESQLEDIFYPGGCAFRVEPSEKNKQRAQGLLDQRLSIKLQIESLCQ